MLGHKTRPHSDPIPDAVRSEAVRAWHH